jgi:hypothetical protein
MWIIYAWTANLLDYGLSVLRFVVPGCH